MTTNPVTTAWRAYEPPPSLDHPSYSGDMGSCPPLEPGRTIATGFAERDRRRLRQVVAELFSCASLHHRGNRGCTGARLDRRHRDGNLSRHGSLLRRDRGAAAVIAVRRPFDHLVSAVHGVVWPRNDVEDR